MLGGVSNGHKTDQERNRLSIVHSQQILDEFIGLELFQAFNISEHLVCARHVPGAGQMGLKTCPGSHATRTEDTKLNRHCPQAVTSAATTETLRSGKASLRTRCLRETWRLSRQSEFGPTGTERSDSTRSSNSRKEKQPYMQTCLPLKAFHLLVVFVTPPAPQA